MKRKSSKTLTRRHLEENREYIFSHTVGGRRCMELLCKGKLEKHADPIAFEQLLGKGLHSGPGDIEVPCQQQVLFIQLSSKGWNHQFKFFFFTCHFLVFTFSFCYFLLFCFFNLLFLVTLVPPISPLLTPTPIPHTPSQHPSPPIVCAIASFICTPFLSFPFSLFPFTSGHCPLVLYFHVSSSIFLICLFC